MHAILFNNGKIAKSVCDRFLFLIKLQAVQTPLEMFSWKFFEHSQGSYSSEHSWMAASKKLVKPCMQNQSLLKSLLKSESNFITLASSI